MRGRIGALAAQVGREAVEEVNSGVGLVDLAQSVEAAEDASAVSVAGYLPDTLPRVLPTTTQ